MVGLSNDSASERIAIELSIASYEQYAEGDTRLATATREYVAALQEAALEYEEKHSGLLPLDFSLAYHDLISNDLDC